MRPPAPVALLFLLLSSIAVSPGCVSGAGVGAEFPACGSDSIQVFREQITSVNFNSYKVPAVTSPFANRDLEFLWSNNYASLFNRPLNAARSGGSDSELDFLGKTICQLPGVNAFGFPSTYIRLIYDYLRAPGQGRPASVDVYNTNPSATMGFAVGMPLYGDLDRNHIDTYVFAPKFTGDPLWQSGGVYGGDGGNPYPTGGPSAFLDADEDVSSGHPAVLDSARAYNGNSLNIPGPKPSQVGVSGVTD